MKECIITGKFNCPNEILSGKLCSGCKIPDNHELCDICGSTNTNIEFLYNDGVCFNCNTKLS